MTGGSGSPLSGIAYGGRAHDLSRFVDDPADKAVAAVVRDAASFSTEDRDALRARLDADDCYTLLAFAQRRSASGIRDGSLEAAREAVQALTLVTASKIDYRDLSVDFPLYAVGRLGGDLTEALASAAANSESGTSASFTARAGRAERLTLKDCALLEVNSRYGLGFLETWARPYAPESDLAGMAVRMADAIDAARRYAVNDLHLSSLPEVWFDRPAKPPGDIPVNGCVRASRRRSRMALVGVLGCWSSSPRWTVPRRRRTSSHERTRPRRSMPANGRERGSPLRDPHRRLVNPR
jgi:hypothetical protein